MLTTTKTAIQNLTLFHLDLVIPQSNGYDIVFRWNDQEYGLVTDLSFWNQPYPTKNFMDRIAKQYAGEVIIGESKTTGFQPVKSQQNSDRSNILFSNAGILIAFN
jgi:RecB family exonuclease